MCIRDRYENGSRTPKADVTAALAQVLDVSPKALDVPDIDSYTGLMHTLFTLCLLYTSINSFPIASIVFIGGTGMEFISVEFTCVDPFKMR